MTLAEFTGLLKTAPEKIGFADTMTLIDSLYRFTPVAFQNGDLFNNSNENNGSCKLFAFALLQGYSADETLHCFGAYYRDEVLGDPEGNSHQNIRNFMQTGWDGIRYEFAPLEERA